MVTETQPVPCLTCVDYDLDIYHNVESLSDEKDISASGTFARNEQSDSNTPTPTPTPQTRRVNSTSSTLETPPHSPQAHSPQSSHVPRSQRRDSSFQKTYGEEDKKKLVPCENCALTIPPNMKEKMPAGTPGSPSKNGQAYNGSPVLRTQKPYEQIPDTWLSPKSTPSDSESSDSGAPASQTLSRASKTSSLSTSAPPHTHYLNYTTTQDPASPTSFSFLRQSCIRTLSHETLPPHSRQIPSSPYTNTQNVTTSGGPIFFGDPVAGYTTAFIFRIPDPQARGRTKIYAFIALSRSHERTAMKAYPLLSNAFRELATWIQRLAEREANRIEVAEHESEYCESPTTSDQPSSLLQYPNSARRVSIISSTSPKSPISPIAREEKLTITPTSAFLAGRTCDPDGYSRKSAASLKARGLAELVGRADFFIELHARFVALLAQLGMAFAQ